MFFNNNFDLEDKRIVENEVLVTNVQKNTRLRVLGNGRNEIWWEYMFVGKFCFYESIPPEGISVHRDVQLRTL